MNNTNYSLSFLIKIVNGHLPVLTRTTPKPKHMWIELTSRDSNLSIEFAIKGAHEALPHFILYINFILNRLKFYNKVYHN